MTALKRGFSNAEIAEKKDLLEAMKDCMLQS